MALLWRAPVKSVPPSLAEKMRTLNSLWRRCSSVSSSATTSNLPAFTSSVRKSGRGSWRRIALFDGRVNPTDDGSAIQCCDTETGGFLAPELTHPECFAITIPSDDAFYNSIGEPRTCMNFVRTLHGLPNDCSAGPAQQVPRKKLSLRLFRIQLGLTVSINRVSLSCIGPCTRRRLAIVSHRQPQTHQSFKVIVSERAMVFWPDLDGSWTKTVTGWTVPSSTAAPWRTPTICDRSKTENCSCPPRLAAENYCRSQRRARTTPASSAETSESWKRLSWRWCTRSGHASTTASPIDWLRSIRRGTTSSSTWRPVVSLRPNSNTSLTTNICPRSWVRSLRSRIFFSSEIEGTAVFLWP